MDTPENGDTELDPAGPDPATETAKTEPPAKTEPAATTEPAGKTEPAGTTKKVLPPKAKAKVRAQQRSTGAAPGSDGDTGLRYTSPSQPRRPPPSPPWVPVAMFGLWGFGLVIIALNYMDVLPGGTDGGNGWYLITGLVAILLGIVAATKYH